MCETRTSCDFLLCSPFCLTFLQVMSQPRRSARLAALPQQTSQVPVEIDLAFRTTCQRILLLFLMTSLFHLPLPASSVTGTSPLLGLSLAASCSAAPFKPTCSASPTWCVHLPSQSVVCPACNAHSPSFDCFCCIHHVEVPAGECMICFQENRRVQRWWVWGLGVQVFRCSGV